MEKHSPLRMLVLGAHPDDAEFHAGGLISIYCQLGHEVKIVSVTNGAAGHHTRQPDELAAIRRAEAAAVGKLVGAAYEVWDFPDGSLQPTLEARAQVIRAIRNFDPDLVLTHRTNDYHPDHRAVGQLVRDASYLVTVPLVVRDTPALRRDPVVAFMADFFTRPAPLRADVVLDVGEVFPQIVKMLDQHRSQVYEWLPYNKAQTEEVPNEDEARLKWLAGWFGQRSRAVADQFREALCSTYGDDRGRQVEYAEAYEISEYATPLDEPGRRRLFPFLP